MTAFERYQRLEGPGLWAPSAEDQRRDVVVRFGEATLIIADARSDQVLSHWSLAATHRINPGQTPALFVPADRSDATPEERLELDDPLMIEALETLDRALSPPRARWLRRGRSVAIAASVVVGLMVAVLWLPGALIGHTASVVPLAKRVQIGQAILDDLTRDGSVAVCSDARGSAALQTLGGRLFASPRRLVVLRGLPEDAPGAFALPGRMIVVGAHLLDRLDSPEALAGALLVEAERAGARDPLQAVLSHAGVQMTVRLLTTGDLPAAALAGYGQVTLAAPRDSVDVGALLDRFEAARIDPVPFAHEAAQGTLGAVIEAGWDARRFDIAVPLADPDWVGLQNICGS